LANTYSFSGTPFTVPAGGTTVVGVYADVLSNANGNLGAVTNVAGLSGTGATSYTSVSLSPNSPVLGQVLAVSSLGSTLNVSINSSYQPAAGQLSMGTTGNTLASLNFNETSNTEDVKLTTLALVDLSASASGTKPSFSNLTLWNGAQEVGSVQSYTATTTVGSGSAPAFLYAFTNLLSNGVGTAYVPRNGVLTLTLKGDANGFTTGNAADLSNHMFEIATSTGAYNTTSSVVVAQGATSGKSASITLPVFASQSATAAPIAGATTQQVLQNALAFSWTPVGASNGRGKSTNDEIADLTFSAANGGSLLLNNATITFSGTAATSTAFLAGVRLLGPSGSPMPTSSVGSACPAVGTCFVVFNLGGVQVNGAQTYKLTVDDSQEAIASGNSSVSLYATVAANTDISYTDAASGGTLTTLPSILQPGNQIFPLNLNSVTFSSGT
jgi:hypothetical protein